MRRRNLHLLAAGLMATGLLCAGNSPPDPGHTPAPTRITVLQAALLGVVEGLTEYLPVSSTGHLVLAGHLMGLSRTSDESGLFGHKLEKTPALDAFDIVIQLGAILAVLGLYRKRVGEMCLGLVGKNASGLKLLALIMLAFLPAAIVGLVFGRPIKEHLFAPVPVTIALAAGGILMIVAEMSWRHRQSARILDLGGIGYRCALVIGLAQCLALWPGMSRSMVTIVAGLLLGFDMVVAAEFSFLVALPTLGAATVYEATRNWGALVDGAGYAGIAIGLAVSGLVAALAVKGFVRWLTGHPLWPFGVYRIILAGALIAAFLLNGF